MASPRFANAPPFRDRTPILAVALFALLAITPAASANTGTALIWLGCSHLVIGNLLIAFLEADILSKVLSARFGRMFGLLLIANYVSMGVGHVLAEVVDTHAHEIWPSDVSVIVAARWILLASIVIAYVITVLIEWPFAYLGAMKSSRRNSRKRVFAANLLAQTVSYAILLLLYVVSSRYSFLTRIEVVPPQALDGIPRDVALYYLSSDRGEVHRMGLAAGDEKQMALVAPECESPVLEIEHDEAGEWSIWLNVGEDAERLRVDDGAIAEIATVWTRDDGRNLDVASARGRRTASFQPELDRAVEVFALNSFGVSLFVHERESRQLTLDLAFETPVLRWRLAAPTLINDRFLLIQLEDQLHLIDIENRRIAYLAPGVWPVVVREQHTTNADD